jgi:glutathione S-transferase
MTMTLYHLDKCVDCEKVRLALGVAGVDWDGRPVDPDDRSEVEKVSGQSTVPVLVDGETVVVDGNRILEYLASREGSTLLPESRRAHTLTRLLVEHADRAIAPLVFGLRRRTTRDGEPLSDDDLAVLRLRLDGELDRLDGVLEGRPFLFGDRPTLADLAHHAYLNRLASSTDWEVPASQPRVRGWFERVEVAAGR